MSWAMWNPHSACLMCTLTTLYSFTSHCDHIILWSKWIGYFKLLQCHNLARKSWNTDDRIRISGTSSCAFTYHAARSLVLGRRSLWFSVREEKADLKLGFELIKGNPTLGKRRPRSNRWSQMIGWVKVWFIQMNPSARKKNSTFDRISVGWVGGILKLGGRSSGMNTRNPRLGRSFPRLIWRKHWLGQRKTGLGRSARLSGKSLGLVRGSPRLGRWSPRFSDKSFGLDRNLLFGWKKL